jgi:hypothetical protein
MNLLAELTLVPGLLVFAGCGTAPSLAPPKTGLVLSMPCDSYGNRSAYVDCKPPYPLYVLLKNAGGQSLRLWEEGCSWGWDCLQLEVVSTDSQTHIIKKKPIAWYSNFPRWVTLQPGEAMVWKVELASGAWSDLSWVPQTNGFKAQVTAVYSVVPDDDSSHCRVWTGRTASPPYAIQFYRAVKRDSE